MQRKNVICSVFVLFLCSIILVSCSSKETEKKDDIPLRDMKLIYEETISANKAYVKDEGDIVNYTVEVYQDNDYKILVYAKSNSEFFEPLQYELEYDKEIAESDVNIEWTTMMGNPNPTEDDQLGIAYVSISETGNVFSKQKISFVNKAIEIVGDTVKGK